MPKRDWRNGLAIGLTVGICLATLLYVYASFFHGEISCRQYDQGGNAQSSYKEGQQEECKVPQWWSVTQSLVSSEDTLAQWIMAVLSVIAVAVSAWAVVLVRDSLRATNLALDEAKTANALAASAVDEARQSNENSRQIGEATIRAYPVVELSDLKMTYRKSRIHLSGQLEVKVRNFGATPAYGCVIKLFFSPLTKAGGGGPFALYQHGDIVLDIPQNKEELSYVSVYHDVCQPENWKWLKDGARVHVKIECSFADVFDLPRSDTFAFEGTTVSTSETNTLIQFRKTSATS
jgi:hypothetical protein